MAESPVHVVCHVLVNGSQDGGWVVTTGNSRRRWADGKAGKQTIDRQSSMHAGRQVKRQDQLRQQKQVRKATQATHIREDDLNNEPGSTVFCSGLEYELAMSDWESGGFMERLISVMWHTWERNHAHAQEHRQGRGRQGDQTDTGNRQQTKGEGELPWCESWHAMIVGHDQC